MHPQDQHLHRHARLIRVAVFYTKVHCLDPQIPRPPDRPPAPLELLRATATIDRVINDYAEDARLETAA